MRTLLSLVLSIGILLLSGCVILGISANVCSVDAQCDACEECENGTCVPMDDPPSSCTRDRDDRDEEPDLGPPPEIWLPGDPLPPQAVVFEGDLRIENSADVDDAERFTHVTGSVLILAPGLSTVRLPQLVAIGESLIIGDVVDIFSNITGPNDALHTLDLPSLVSIGGDLSVYDNEVLPSLDGLSALRAFAGHLEIKSNDALTQIDGLSGLVAATHVIVSHNPFLETLQGLRNVKAITCDCNSGRLEIGFNDSLATLGNTWALESIDGLLSLDDLPALSSLAALSQLTTASSVLLSRLPLLTSLHGLHSVAETNGTLHISHTTLTDLTGLGAGIGSKELYIADNPLLVSLVGLAPIIGEEKYIHLVRNPILADISVLSGATSASKLGLEDCPAIDLAGTFERLTSVKVFELDGMPQVTDLGGFSGLASLRSVQLKDMEGLRNLGGLEGVIGSVHSLDIEGNTALQDVAALAGLTSVTTGVSLKRNPALTGLVGLHHIQSIGDTLVIEENASLSTIDLEPLQSVGSLIVSKNPNLPTCAAEQLRDRLQFTHLTPFVRIDDNGEGSCSSP